MARRYGVLNKKPDSRLRRCAVSGLRFYESEMVNVGENRFIHPKYLDRDYFWKPEGRRGRRG